MKSWKHADSHFKVFSLLLLAAALAVVAFKLPRIHSRFGTTISQISAYASACQIVSIPLPMACSCLQL